MTPAPTSKTSPRVSGRDAAAATRALLGPSGPNVDESNMIFFGESSAVGPAVRFDFSAPRVVRKEPMVDLTAQSMRWKVLDGGPGKVGFRHLLGSFALHGFVAGAVVGAGAFMGLQMRPEENEEQVVEIAFGFDVTSQSVSSAPARLGDSAADQEATKTEQQLPQLPKLLAVESAPTDAQNMPLPPVEGAEELKKETENANTDAAADAKPALKETPPPEVRALSAEELARRAERESRKVAKEEQAGTHSNPGSGRAALPSDQPESPFSNNNVDVSALPDALPQGSLQGKVDVSIKGEYTTSVFNHIRRLWNLPNTRAFDPNLKAEITFEVNAFGRLIGVPKVQTPSGDAEFDEVALQTVKDAVPYPELPKGLGPRQKMTHAFRPQDSKN